MSDSKDQGICSDIPNKIYHANDGRYSSTLIKKMAVPAEAKYMMDNGGEYKDCFRFGSAVHKYILEQDSFSQEFLVGINVRRAGKDNKAVWSDWFSANGAEGDSIIDLPADQWNKTFEKATGKNIVLASELDQIKEMAKTVMQNSTAMDLLTGGEAEQSVYWTDKETGLKLKCRPDYLSGSISDLKSIALIDDRTIRNQSIRFGYHISAEMYREGVFHVTGEYKRFIFIFINTKPPYFCRTFELSEALAEEGHERYRAGVMKLAECLDSDIWPGYPDKIETLMAYGEEELEAVDYEGVEVE